MQGSIDAENHAKQSVECGANRVQTVAALVAELTERIGADRVSRDFGGGNNLRVDQSGVVVSTESAAAADVLSRRYGAILESITGVTARFETQATGAVAAKPAESARVVKRAAVVERAAGVTLDELVTGPGNRLAIDAARRLARRELSAGAALYIHGPCGQGKTHILAGIVEESMRSRPGSNARLVSAETFANEFIAACKSDKPDRMEKFRRLYRGCDVLCIDDLQSLMGKDKTQIELQHTIDAIASRGGRVACSANVAPRVLCAGGATGAISEGLVSRFLSGLVAEISPPDGVMSVQIVQRAAAKRGLTIDAVAADAMVQSAMHHPRGGHTLSVRELEGLVVKVEAVHRLLGAGSVSGSVKSGPQAVGLIAVQAALGGTMHGPASRPGVIARIGPRMPVRLEHVVHLTCEAFGVTMAEVAARGRHERVVLARAAATLLARQHTSASYPEIAKALGRPNHSTVITAHQRLKGQLEGALVVDLGEGRGRKAVREIVQGISQSLVGEGSSQALA